MTADGRQTGSRSIRSSPFVFPLFPLRAARIGSLIVAAVCLSIRPRAVVQMAAAKRIAKEMKVSRGARRRGRG